MKKRLGILLSGRGSNFEAIADAIDTGRIHDAEIAVVISNRPGALGIQEALERGLDAVVVPSKGRKREEFDADVVKLLQEKTVDLVCLAGFMRLLSPVFIRAYPTQILNIHPALLPAFPGLEGQKQALDHGVKFTGCTVHFVDEELDHGPIVAQSVVEVHDDDTEESLSARLLEAEHRIYAEAINFVLDGKWRIQGRRVIQT